MSYLGFTFVSVATILTNDSMSFKFWAMSRGLWLADIRMGGTYCQTFSAAAAAASVSVRESGWVVRICCCPGQYNCVEKKKPILWVKVAVYLIICVLHVITAGCEPWDIRHFLSMLSFVLMLLNRAELIWLCVCKQAKSGTCSVTAWFLHGTVGLTPIPLPVCVCMCVFVSSETKKKKKPKHSCTRRRRSDKTPLVIWYLLLNVLSILYFIRAV